MPEPGRGGNAGEDAALDTVMKAAVLLQESGQLTSMTMVAVVLLLPALAVCD
jgi:hypothetical protein